MRKRGRPPHPDILTPREWEVLELLREGLSNPEIAERMAISREGVKYHVSEILSKLGVASREEAALWSAPAAEERWPGWTAALAPVAVLCRRVGAVLPGRLSAAAMALSAILLVAVLAVLGVIAFLLLGGEGGPGATELVSVNSAREPANADISEFALSADGRYVAFTSGATNLVANDINEAPDVFVHDRETGITEAVSVNSDGQLRHSGGSFPSISADGRYVAFCSPVASPLAGSAGYAMDVFIRDRELGTTEFIGTSSIGGQGFGVICAALSANGRYVAFQLEAGGLVAHDTNQASDVFVYDRETETTERISVSTPGTEGDGRSHAPAISADGRFVAFSSSATDLVPGDNNGASDVFVHDREAGVTERVSVPINGGGSDNGGAYPAISGDGRFVAFYSRTGDLDGVRLRGCSFSRKLAPSLWDDTCPAVFLRDRWAGTTGRTRLITPQRYRWDTTSSPRISADGRYVALIMGTDSFVVYVYDREAGNTYSVVTIDRVPRVYPRENQVAISGDGRYVAFGSSYSELVPADTGGWWQIYVHDREK